MLLKIHPKHPEGRKIEQATDVLKQGGVIIYPTDGVYALGCDLLHQSAADRICKLRNLDPMKANLTLVCKDISQISDYARQMDNTTFRLLKRNLPGPFTFVMTANNKIPKIFRNKRSTIGVRIPDNKITEKLIESLDRPILSISLKSDDKGIEYYTDPEYIHEQMTKLVDIVVGGDVGDNTPSTVVDVTGDEPEILRQGAGELV